MGLDIRIYDDADLSRAFAALDEDVRARALGLLGVLEELPLAEAVAEQDIILALVEENAYGRIRHRAQIETLSSGYSPEKYFARFVELCRRDFQPLVYRAVATSEAFSRRFAAWERENDRYYDSLWGGAPHGETPAMID